MYLATRIVVSLALATVASASSLASVRSVLHEVAGAAAPSMRKRPQGVISVELRSRGDVVQSSSLIRREIPDTAAQATAQTPGDAQNLAPNTASPGLICADSTQTGIKWPNGELASCPDLEPYCNHKTLGTVIQSRCMRSCGQCLIYDDGIASPNGKVPIPLDSTATNGEHVMGNQYPVEDVAVPAEAMTVNDPELPVTIERSRSTTTTVVGTASTTEPTPLSASNAVVNAATKLTMTESTSITPPSTTTATTTTRCDDDADWKEGFQFTIAGKVASTCLELKPYCNDDQHGHLVIARCAKTCGDCGLILTDSEGAVANSEAGDKEADDKDKEEVEQETSDEDKEDAEEVEQDNSNRKKRKKSRNLDQVARNNTADEQIVSEEEGERGSLLE